MAKKKHKQNWQRNIKIDEQDNEFLNTKHWYEPEDFNFQIPEEFTNGIINYLQSQGVSDIILESTRDYLNNMKLPYDFLYSICSYLNRLRIEYVTLKWNGMPLKSYKPDVYLKISKKKDASLAKKKAKADVILKGLGLSLKDDFDPHDENSRPRD